MKTTLNKQMYTIVFNDGYEKHVSATIYQLIKERISQWQYAIEIDQELLNLKYYKRISPRLITDDIEHYVMSQDKTIRMKLMTLMKLRQKMYPYKQPFESVDQVKRMIKDMKSWKL
jgi:hypothetical protein